jgi:hypothetical protein
MVQMRLFCICCVGCRAGMIVVVLEQALIDRLRACHDPF